MKSEMPLQHLWRTTAVPLTNLRDAQGRRVDVIDPGRWNRADGPDFLDACIAADGVLCRGDIEIHLHSADWYHHGHHKNPAFNRVILHVALDLPAKPLFRLDGSPVPCVDLTAVLPEWLQASPHPVPSGLPCAPALPFLEDPLLSQLGVSASGYFEELARNILALFTSAADREPVETAWKRAFFLRCCSVLGIPNNRSQMTAAGAKLWQHAAKPPDGGPLFSWLATDLDGAAIDWNMSGARPASHPKIRSRQACGILAAIKGTSITDFEKRNPDALASALWRETDPPLGAPIRRALKTTALLPALWVLHTLGNAPKPAALTRERWHRSRLPASPDAARAFTAVAATVPRELHKGLTHLWRGLCQRRLCHECLVGKACGLGPRS